MNALEYIEQSTHLPRANVLRQQIPDFESPPVRLLRWAVLDWLIILAVWAAMAWLDSGIVSMLGIFIVASRLQALGALLHDACHSRVRSRAWPIVEALAGWPIASTIAAMRYHHMRHHRHSGTELDPYRNRWIDRGPGWRALLALRGVLLPLRWTLRAVVAPFAQFSRPIRTLYARAFLQDRDHSNPADSNEAGECISADRWQLLAQITLFSGALLSNFVLYPHNLGLHRAHHLFPTASFVHLPRLDAVIRESLGATPRL